MEDIRFARDLIVDLPHGDMVDISAAALEISNGLLAHRWTALDSLIDRLWSLS